MKIMATRGVGFIGSALVQHFNGHIGNRLLGGQPYSYSA